MPDGHIDAARADRRRARRSAGVAAPKTAAACIVIFLTGRRFNRHRE
jgi:hypothetical protein